MYKEIAEFMLNGRPVVMTLAAARDSVLDLTRQAQHSARAEAELVASAGWVMMQFAGDRKYGVYNRLYLRFGVSAQRGKRMRRFAEQFINPDTGCFDEAAWEAERTGALRRQAEAKAAVSNPAPSVREDPNEMGDGNFLVREYPNKQVGSNQSVRVDPNQKGDGNFLVRYDPNKSQGDDRVGGRLADFDPIAAAMAALPRPKARAGGPAPSAPAGGVGATQPEVPWHLAESARTLAERAAEFERAVERGEVEPAFAHDIQARIDGLLSDIAAAKAGAA